MKIQNQSWQKNISNKIMMLKRVSAVDAPNCPAYLILKNDFGQKLTRKHNVSHNWYLPRETKNIKMS